MDTLTLNREGLTLRAHLLGPAQGQLVILLHGFPDTPHSWDAVAARLAAQGYRVLMPWLRGYTPESALRAARYDLLAVAADIAAWQEHVGSGPAHLVGHDWGAGIAMVLVGTDAAPWRSLGLLAIPPLPPTPVLRQLLPLLPCQLRLSSYMPLMQANASHRLVCRNQAAYVERLWRRWSPGWDFSAAQFAPTRAVFCQPDLAWAATRYYRNLFTLQRAASREVFRRMAASTGQRPTLALAGQRDGCMSIPLHAAIVEAMQARGVPGLTAIQLPDCGHFLQAERPDAVADALHAHWSGIDQH